MLDRTIKPTQRNNFVAEGHAPGVSELCADFFFFSGLNQVLFQSRRFCRFWAKEVCMI